MYSNFFGFAEKPFDLTPGPEFLHLSRVNVEALVSLTCGIHERRGFIVLVGELGTDLKTFSYHRILHPGCNLCSLFRS